MPVATFDEIFSSGSRSFAIWTGRGELTFDKGDDLADGDIGGHGVDRALEPESEAVGSFC
jgi:hypothetical protein